MPNKKISEMTAATSLGDTDYVPILQGGANKKAPYSIFGLGAVTTHTGTSWDGSPKYRQLTGNLALTFATSKRSGFFIFKQDATGSRTLTINGTSVAISATANSYTVVTFTYNDATSSYIFSVDTNIVGNVTGGDATAPTLVSATIENANPDKIILTYSESLDTGSVPAAGAYVVTFNGIGVGVSSVGIVGAVVTVTLTSSAVSSDAVLLDYTPGGSPVQDIAGNDAAALSAQAVTNNVVGFDADATAFFTAAGITDGTQKSAVNQLVLDLKAATVWTKMKIIYPFVGGDATKHSYNLKNPANFQITWGGTVTHNANGYTGDGSTGYGATGFIPSTDMSAESAYVGVWSKTNASGEYIDIGANDGSGGCFCKTRAAGGDLTFRINTGDVTAGTADSIGYFAASQVAGPLSKLYEDGSAITPAVNHGDYRTGYALTVGCLNNSGTNYGYSARNIAGIVVGDGLTDAEHTAVYNALAAMQTTLGR